MDSHQALPNTALAELIGDAEISAVGLARRVREIGAEWGHELHTSHTQVGRWLRGQQPREPTPALIAEALSRKLGRRITLDDIGMDADGRLSPELGLVFATRKGDAIQTLTDLWTADVQRRSFLTSTVTATALTEPVFAWLVARPADPEQSRGKRHVGMADVQIVTSTAKAFADLDNQFGGGTARSAAIQYLTDQVAPMLHGSYTDLVGRALFAAVAEFTKTVAWMAYDSGHQSLARRYFIQALNLAHHSDDRLLGASVLSAMSHQANYLQEGRSAVHLARAARNGAEPCSSASAIADFAAMEARAAAAMGERSEALHALADAEAAFERRDPDSDPPWINYFDPSEMADEVAHTLRDLGDFPRARQAAQTCLELAGPEYARSRVFSQIVLAQSLLGAGEPEEAARIGLRVLPQAAELTSVRIAGYIRTLRSSVQPYQALPAVAEFNLKSDRVLRGQPQQ